MSWENTQCPCGEKKLTDTMLCPACEAHVGQSYDRKLMDDPAAHFDARRSAAIRVLQVARRRVKSLPLAFEMR